MKVLFSRLKKYLPDLQSGVREVADVYTKTGFMLDKIIEVKFLGETDFLLDLEVRQNRADSFGVYGLARELAAYYNIKLLSPSEVLLESYKDFANSDSNYQIPIEVLATKDVKRVMAVKINNIRLGESAPWIKEYLSLYEINSINNLVDLTNLVMLETSHASHVFDTDLTGDNLKWETGKGNVDFETLSGVILKLDDSILTITNNSKVLSLSFIGGKVDAVNENTKNILLEVAVYNGGTVRQNSRKANVLTEAQSRLEKYLDPESIPETLNILTNLILNTCGGEVVSQIFDCYTQKTLKNEILVDLEKLQKIAGIQIEKEKSIQILKNLGFTSLNNFDTKDGRIKVVAPINRLDIEIEEDVFEEIIRMIGYDKIEFKELSIKSVTKITPNILNLIDRIQVIAVNEGFDEVRSWVLVDEQKNFESNFNSGKAIRVSNSINEEAPFLRQNLIVSIIGQAEVYKKNNVPDIKIFEIGKVFNKVSNEYFENYAISLLEIEDLNSLKNNLEKILRGIGLNTILYKKAGIVPKNAIPLSCFEIYSEDKSIGIIYKTNKNKSIKAVVCEVSISVLDSILQNISYKSVHEIEKKLIELDTNIITNSEVSITQKISELLKSDLNSIWKWEIVDEFSQEDGQIKYTVRVFYVNLSDPEAKELNKKIFSI